MATRFGITVEGERVTINLYSRSEYEANGGRYTDAGNGGESFSPDERDQFVAAAAVEYNDSGLPDNDVLEAAGLGRADYWLDSVADMFLLRDWPAEAPLAARMVNDASSVLTCDICDRGMHESRSTCEECGKIACQPCVESADWSDDFWLCAECAEPTPATV